MGLCSSLVYKMNDDIAIETTPASSSDDETRREMLWKTRPEGLVTQVAVDALVTSAKHERAAWKAKRFHQALGLLSVVLPLGASVASEHASPVVNSALMLAAAVSSGVNQFLNYGAKSRHHFEYQSRWADLASNIDFELAKSRSDRVAADMFLEGVRTRLAAMRSSEPAV